MGLLNDLNGDRLTAATARDMISVCDFGPSNADGKFQKL